MMRLTISKEGGRFAVDDRSHPGSPTVGRGRTIREAIGDYFHGNQTALGIEFVVDASAREAERRRRGRELARR